MGPDGKPKQDYDHDDHGLPDTHPHDENGGHYHDWDWSNKERPRGMPYIIDSEPVIGTAQVVAGCIIIWGFAKWGVAIAAAPETGGLSIAGAALLP